MNKQNIIISININLFYLNIEELITSLRECSLDHIEGDVVADCLHKQGEELV